MRQGVLFPLVALAGASTLKPPVVPLIVRNPYLSTWLSPARRNPWEQWPMFWTGERIGFGVMAHVPDSQSVVPLLGRLQDALPGPSFNVSYPEYLGTTFDASATNLTYTVRNVAQDKSATVILSFLSPITPTSTFRQSLPAAYLTVTVEGSFDLGIYLDLNGQWVSGNRGNTIRWTLSDDSAPMSSYDGTGPPLKTWKVSRETQELYTEFNDRGEWGALHFTGPAGVDHEAGTSAKLRQHFATKGHLRNETDPVFRGIMDREPAFAFSKHFKLGGQNSTKDDQREEKRESVLFTIALTQDPIAQFAAARGLTHMRPFWANFLRSDDELVRYHYDDFAVANLLASNYSRQLSHDAYASGSTAYEEIAGLSARQVLGSTEFAGTVDNPLLFLKEISSNGNAQTVDVIFPAFPFFLYTNPKWLAYLLEPLLEHQLSGQYPNNYSLHDLGGRFPNLTGHPDGGDEYMPVEECGNMLIMALAIISAFRSTSQSASASLSLPLWEHGVATHRLQLSRHQQRHTDAFGIDRSLADTATTGQEEAEKWAERSYRLWKQWTGYLVEFSLLPESQLSTDDFAGWLRYQSNLALKGIIGIRAMAEISFLVGADEDERYYRNVSETYIAKWREYAVSRDGSHVKLSYDWYGSWTTLYNLYADSLLCLRVPPEGKSDAAAASFDDGRRYHQRPLRGGRGGQRREAARKDRFVPDEIYKMQSDWYHHVRQKYGLPLDSRHLYAKSDWEFFAAAVSSNATRKELLDSVSKWVDETSTDKPLTDLYDTEGEGGFPGIEFKARPVVGGHFAFLALERACGGKAIEALRFLDEHPLAPLDVAASLNHDIATAAGGHREEV